VDEERAAFAAYQESFADTDQSAAVPFSDTEGR
jgi:hypothetical protein